MRRNRGYIFCVTVCVLALSVPVCSQIKKPPPSIAIIDTGAFYDDSSGIKELSDALRPLDEELKPFNEDVKAHVKKYNDLVKHAQDFFNHGELPVSASKIQEIIDDITDERDLIRGKEIKGKEFYDRRFSELTKPFMPKIREVLNEFAASRGFALILDKSKLETSQVVTSIDNFPDVTADFIKFFNSKYLNIQKPTQ